MDKFTYWVNFRCKPKGTRKEPRNMSLLELFVSVDDFCQIFLPVWEKKLLANGSKKRCRAGPLRLSESMTIILYFPQSQYRNFKAYNTEQVCKPLSAEFPNVVT